MKYIVTLNDKQYEVEVEKGKAVAAYIGEAPAPAPGAAAPASHQDHCRLLLRQLRQAQVIRSLPRCRVPSSTFAASRVRP